MKVNLEEKKVQRFQEGGAAPVADPSMKGTPAPEGAPAPEGEDPTAQLQQVAALIVQQLGPEGAMTLAQMIMEMVQGGGAAEPAQPMMQRQGGRLRRIG